MVKRMAHTPDVFKGISKNIMTPNIVSYWRVKNNNVTRYVELSEGRGLSNQPIFGVTVRPDLDFEHKLSRLFQSETLAVSYIHELDSCDEVAS